MARRRKSGFKINTGKWGKPTSVRIGSRGKGNINISKKGVKYNPGCGCVLVIGIMLASAISTSVCFLLVLNAI